MRLSCLISWFVLEIASSVSALFAVGVQLWLVIFGTYLAGARLTQKVGAMILWCHIVYTKQPLEWRLTVNFETTIGRYDLLVQTYRLYGRKSWPRIVCCLLCWIQSDPYELMVQWR